MRKSIILFVTMLLMALPMHSQVFLTQKDLDEERQLQWEDAKLIIPIQEKGSEEEESYAPMGSGLALLAALGGAYLLGKRKKD